MQKQTNHILLIGFAICLLQVWWPEYYLTGDGPCHVYNAQIFHDLLFNKHPGFYEHYYKVFYQPNPNWLSTVILAMLISVVNGIVAEKIFLTIYIALFIGGFYLLLKKISSIKSYWPLVILIFIFPHVLYKGFYNYSISIAFYFWAVWSWLRILEKKSMGDILLFLLFISSAFFSHLLAFVFCAGTCGALIISHAVAGFAGEGKRVRYGFFFKNAGLLLLLLSPFIGPLFWFTGKEGGIQVHITHHFYRLVELMEFKHIICLRLWKEMPFTTLSGCVLLLLFFAGIIYDKISFRIHKYDGFLWSLVFVTFVYVCFPDDIIGRAMDMTLRTQLFVFILVVCCTGYMHVHIKMKNAGALIVFGCFIALSIIHFKYQNYASKAVADYTSASKYIKPYSVVLPLDFAPGGMDESGHIIADWNNSFGHASDYMGTEKPLVILDNYEANMGYFPLKWNEAVNPYNHLSEKAGIERIPPYANINGYKQTCGITIDYILMFGHMPVSLGNEDFKSLCAVINEEYHVIYTSPTGRTVLYALNKRL